MNTSLFFILILRPSSSTLFPYTTLFRSFDGAYFYLSGWNLKYSEQFQDALPKSKVTLLVDDVDSPTRWVPRGVEVTGEDRKSTRLNSSHVAISYAVFCLKKKNRCERDRA